MKTDYHIIGIQRSGTNYLETLIRDNFDGVALYAARSVWKHSVDIPTLYKGETPTILIHKNPYTWIESIAWRNTVDWLKTQKKYPADEAPEDKDFCVGPKNLNMINLIMTWRDFHDTWHFNNNDSKKLIKIKYEDFLIEKTREERLDAIQREFNWKKRHNNWVNPKRGAISQSRRYTESDELYYIAGVPKYLTKKQIDKINEILGKDNILAMGYTVL
jgi:hypothetical protein